MQTSPSLSYQLRATLARRRIVRLSGLAKVAARGPIYSGHLQCSKPRQKSRTQSDIIFSPKDINQISIGPRACSGRTDSAGIPMRF
jgi:hypothetical protein